MKFIRYFLVFCASSSLIFPISFYEALKNIPYLEFRNLICSGDYFGKTAWFYQFIEIKEQKWLFTRDSQDKIDLKHPKGIEEEINFDELHHKYFVDFEAICYQIFVERAIDEIVNHDMPWSQAVSMMDKDGQPRFPIVYTTHASGVYILNDVIDRYDEGSLVLGQIFAGAYGKYFPEGFPVKTEITTPPFATVSFKALDMKWSIDLPEMYPSSPQRFIDRFGMKWSKNLYEKEVQERNQMIKKEKQYAVQYFLNSYCESLGQKNPSDDSGFSDMKKILSQENYRGAIAQRVFKDKQERQKRYDTNWVLAAQQTFQLGRLLFGNKLDAFDKLGGQDWLSQQPKDMIKIIEDHVEKLQPTLKQKFLRWYGADSSSLQDVQGQLSQG